MSFYLLHRHHSSVTQVAPVHVCVLKVPLLSGTFALGSKTHGHWSIFPMLLAYSTHRRWGYTILHCHSEKLLHAEQTGQDPYNKICISSQLLFIISKESRGTLNEVRTLAARTGRLVMLGLRQEARHLTVMWFPRLFFLCCSALC